MEFLNLVAESVAVIFDLPEAIPNRKHELGLKRINLGGPEPVPLDFPVSGSYDLLKQICLKQKAIFIQALVRIRQQVEDWMIRQFVQIILVRDLELLVLPEVKGLNG